MNGTGLNTNNRPEERNIIVISDTERGKGKDQSTTQPAIASHQNNTAPTLKEPADLEKDYTPEIFSEPLPIDSINAADIPYHILRALRNPLANSHFVTVAPNASAACLVTPESLAYLPPGYVVVFVLPEAPEILNPPNHIDGKIYLVK